MSLDALSVLPAVAKTPVPLPTGAYAPTGAQDAARARIDKTAKDFEASYLSVMFGEMFKGVSTPAPFGGGEGEEAFRSFLTEAMAKSMTKHGGVGLAGSVRKELLKLQGLS